MTPRMHPQDLERLADLVADRLAQRLTDKPSLAPASALVDSRTLADQLGLSADFVREHAQELGGFRITDNPRAPWRFDLEVARERLAARAGRGRSPQRETPTPRRRPGPPAGKRPGSAGRSLAIRG